MVDKSRIWIDSGPASLLAADIPALVQRRRDFSARRAPLRDLSGKSIPRDAELARVSISREESGCARASDFLFD